MSLEVLVAPRDALLATMFDRLVAARARAIESRGGFALAVPGGSVAEALFPMLCNSTFDWRRTDLFWVDERGVPPDDPDSNSGRARALGLDRVGLEPGRVHRMHGEADDLDAAAAAAAADLVRSLGDPPRLDLAILGVGPDGHVASLFPGHPAVRDRRPVVAIRDAPKPPPCRLTVTLAVLGAARRLWIVAFGSEKAAAVRAAVREPGEPPGPHPGGAQDRLPVALAVRSGPPVTFFLDPEAGSDLGTGPPRS
jgi:6-phosphogluconolactonase